MIGFLKEVLVESTDVHTLVHTLNLYCKVVESLTEIIQGNEK